MDVTEILDIENIKCRIYPNPANSELIIESGMDEIMVFELYDVCGIKTLKQEIYPSVNNINISTLPNGMYLYKIYNGNKNIKYGTLIINHN